MPCGDGGFHYPETHLGFHFGEWIDGFCSACTALEGANIPIPPSAAALWEAHKIEDSERVKSEKAEEEVKRLREIGLSKLTAEERDALGLRGESSPLE